MPVQTRYPDLEAAVETTNQMIAIQNARFSTCWSDPADTSTFEKQVRSILSHVWLSPSDCEHVLFTLATHSRFNIQAAVPGVVLEILQKPTCVSGMSGAPANICDCSPGRS